MDSNLLVAEQIEAGADFLGRLSKTLPVKGAFWARLSDNGKWFLYVIYDPPDGRAVSDGYEQVISVRHEMQNPLVGFGKVKLIDSGNRQASALLDLYRRFPDGMPARYDDEMVFGDRFVDGLYLYPAPAEMSVS